MDILPHSSMPHAAPRWISATHSRPLSAFKRRRDSWESWPGTGGHGPSRPFPAPVQATSRDTDSITNPFFYGKALAEVLNERLGRLAADTLAGVGTFEAEFRKAMDEIQEEVVERAQYDIETQNMGGADRAPGSDNGRQRRGMAIAARAAAAAMDEDEIVDNLRAEIASTRSLIQQTKAGMTANKK